MTPMQRHRRDETASIATLDKVSLINALHERLTYTVGKDRITATTRDWTFAAAYVARDRLIERWMQTMRSYYHDDVKRVYYLSLEFMVGRLLTNGLLAMGIHDAMKEALRDLGHDYDVIREQENDMGLGNGGLGRLAACFLDSLATLGMPGYGYGIRYEYGIFRQRIEDGHQVEHPDNWLRYGNPWEFARPEVLYPVNFYGRVVEYRDERGRTCRHWTDTEQVMAMAYDTPVPGFRNNAVNNMRLWAAKATRDFDLRYFNEGNYIKAVEDKNQSENLSKVLYPDDSTSMGRELRLRQQYFFVCASLQDILYRFRKSHAEWDTLPDKVAIQLNDTHPSIAIPELMRILLDEARMEWDHAWGIVTKTFAYTNHTLMPEALETWPVVLMERVLPRHMQIIFEINFRFLRDVMHRFPGDHEILSRMSIIDENGGRRVRMAHLAIVGSHHVNGVARIHTDLMKSTIFRDFHAFDSNRIVNITNGITPRRWLNQANPALASLITSRIGTSWTTDLSELKRLGALAGDTEFRRAFREVKHANKQQLADQIGRELNVQVSPDSLFDVQIKRIHEYKRQLLNLLHVVTRYNRLRCGQMNDAVARTVLISGKAAPAYRMAKQIIKLANDIADVVNNDPSTKGMLKLAFIPDYKVTTAADIVPAADLSEQISTAGTEASGTGNMKLALNGALTIGTLDGANVEICDAVGKENIFIFGMKAHEVDARQRAGYNPWDWYHGDEELREVLDMISGGYFSLDEPDRHRPIVEAITHGGDHYMLLADYRDYVIAQERVDALYRDPEEWSRRAILNVANMGWFSSDRTIQEYADKIWNVKPLKRS